VKAKEFTAPLTVSMGSVFVKIDPFSFSFDSGAKSNLKGDAKINLNQDVQIGDTTIRILTIHRGKTDDYSPAKGVYAYQIDIKFDPNVVGTVYIRTSNDQCPQPPYTDPESYPTERSSLGLAFPLFSCPKDMAPGQLKVQVTSAVLWGPWQISWTP
jgi:hypothetical protein